MNKKLIITLINVMFLIGYNIISLANELTFTRSLLCGPNSLLYVCEKYGVKTNIEELCESTGFRKRTGTSMLGIYKAALEKGLNVNPIKTDINGLCNNGELSIVFILDHHFTVCAECTKDSITIIDYPEKAKRISKNVFQKVWDGEALVFNMTEKQKSKISPKDKHIKGPKIIFVSTIRDFGKVEQGSILKHTFQFMNVGSEPLHIRVRSSCKCTATLLSKETTLPGETGKINIEYNTLGKNGYQEVSILCRTNDPEQKLIKLKLISEVSKEVFPVPEKVYIENIITGCFVKKIIKLYKSTKSNFEIIDINCPNGIEAKILPKEDSQYYNYIIPVELTIYGTKKLGSFEKKVIINTNDISKKIIEIPIKGNIERPFKIFPPQLIIPDAKSNSIVTKEISVSSINEESFRINEILPSDKNISFEKFSLNNTKSHKLILNINTPEKEKYYEGFCQIKISTNDEMVLTLPIFVKIEDN